MPYRIPYILTDAADPDLTTGPTKAHADDAAYDLCSAEDRSISPGFRALVNTGIAVAIPKGYAGLVLPRSGLAIRHGITVLNSPGLIDPGYRGDICVILANLGNEIYEVETGDRIAQLLIVKTADVKLLHAAWLPHSERAESGFGSTGR